jgi:hypothetical protein
MEREGQNLHFLACAKRPCKGARLGGLKATAFERFLAMKAYLSSLAVQCGERHRALQHLG